MRQFLTAALLAALTLMANADPARAALLTFDDISSTPSTAPIPNGYGGFSWSSSFNIANKNFLPNTGYSRGTVSGNYAAFNSFAQVATVSGTPFTFDSAYLTAAWNTGLNIRVEGLNGAAVVYNQVVVVGNQVPTLFNFNYTNITSVRFTSFGGVDQNPNDGGAGTHFVLDNASFNSGAAAVPAPPALVLAGIGALALAGYRRLRRKAA